MTILRVYANELGLSREEVLEMENCQLKIRFIEDFLFRDINEFRNCNLNISVGVLILTRSYSVPSASSFDVDED